MGSVSFNTRLAENREKRQTSTPFIYCNKILDLGPTLPTYNHSHKFDQNLKFASIKYGRAEMDYAYKFRIF
jgi:hypothetical protein